MPTAHKSLSKMNRNLIERERRLQMKNLFSNLFKLLPPQPAKMSVPQYVDYATVYVSQLQKRVEELKQRKMELEAEHILQTRSVSPVIDITDMGSTVDVNVVAGTTADSALCDIISILEEEGAQVVRATYHYAGNKVLLSIHSKETYPRIGINNFRVLERLEKLQMS